jgi:hypothetical protein
MISRSLLYRQLTKNKVKKSFAGIGKHYLYLHPLNGGCSSGVRALDCGSRGRGFNSHLPPNNKPNMLSYTLLGFCVNTGY